MPIDATLQRVEDVIAPLAGRELAVEDAHPVLLDLARVLGDPPYAVVGPRARFRWRLGDLMVEAGVDRFLGSWELGYRAFPYEPDVSRGEYLAFADPRGDIAPPYEWSVALATSQPALPPTSPMPGWTRIGTELGYLAGTLSLDLSTVPPAWFDGGVVLATSLGGIEVEARADRHGLTLRGPGSQVHLDPERAYLARSLIGVAWVGAYAGQPPDALTIRATSTGRPFRLLASPSPDDDEAEPIGPLSFADLARVQAAPAPPVPASLKVPEFLAAYASPEEAAGLVQEVVAEGVPAFVRHHELTAAAPRPGVPELQAAAGWRVRVLSGSLLLTLLESRQHTAEVLAYTRRLIDHLEQAYGPPWGSSLDSRARLVRTWRVGDVAVRAGTSGSAVMVEVTSYQDLLIHHFG